LANNSNIPDIASINNRNKRKRKSKSNLDRFNFGEIEVAYGYIIFDFLYRGMWNRIESNMEEIDNFLDRYELVLDYKLLMNYRKMAKYELLDILILSNDKLKSFYLGKTDSKPSFMINKNKIDSIDPIPLINDIQNTLKQILSKDLEGKIWTLIQFGIAGFLGFIYPLQQLMDSLKR
jgi:hypothetical protein